MALICPSLKTLRALAGEGNFHAYRLLRSGRRGFLFAKCLVTTYSHTLGRGTVASRKTVVFIKGKNQLRFQSFLAPQLEAEFASVDVFTGARLPVEANIQQLARFSPSSVMRQAMFLTFMLATGRRRFLDLYLLEFQAEIDRIVERSFGAIENFVCFNDQPYDVAAILNALERRGNCRTIVIQHGLVLNEKFYFPSVAKEFWAWGELTKRHYRNRNKTGQISVRGRYENDRTVKSEVYLPIPADRPINILVAPSFIHDEVKEIVFELKAVLPDHCPERANVAIKLHPATKFQGRLTHWCSVQAPWLKKETLPVEMLAAKYDVLITKNSTSAVDFLLRGKPVFFHPPPDGADFPSQDYGFVLTQLGPFLDGDEIDADVKNQSRKAFLRASLNVSSD